MQVRVALEEETSLGLSRPSPQKTTCSELAPSAFDLGGIQEFGPFAVASKILIPEIVFILNYLCVGQFITQSFLPQILVLEYIMQCNFCIMPCRAATVTRFEGGN